MIYYWTYWSKFCGDAFSTEKNLSPNKILPKLVHVTFNGKQWIEPIITGFTNACIPGHFSAISFMNILLNCCLLRSNFYHRVLHYITGVGRCFRFNLALYRYQVWQYLGWVVNPTGKPIQLYKHWWFTCTYLTLVWTLRKFRLSSPRCECEHISSWNNTQGTTSYYEIGHEY